MSYERDELAQFIADHDETTSTELADAILADGYRKPQQVTDLGKLKMLPKLSVVRAANGYVLEKLADGWLRAGADYEYTPNAKWLPATVLHEGEA